MIDSGDMSGDMMGTGFCDRDVFSPGLQLVSAFLTLILFACWASPGQKAAQLQATGQDYGWPSVAGTIAGILLMIGIGYVMEKRWGF